MLGETARLPGGVLPKILASDLDEVNKTGSRTRLLKIEPGAFSAEPVVHDHWEEVYVVQGDLVVGNDKQAKAASSASPRLTPAVRRACITARSLRAAAACFMKSTTTMPKAASDPLVRELVIAGWTGRDEQSLRASRFAMELEDPVLGRKLAHEYRVDILPVEG